MYSVIATAAIIALTTVGAGCAGYSITPIAKEDAASHKLGNEGYIIYEPRPYLIGRRVSTNQSDKPNADQDPFSFEIIYLPDRRKPYRFTRHEFLAKSDLEISFKDGWQFTGAKSSTDSTKMLEVLGNIATAAIGAEALDTLPQRTEIVLFEIDTSKGPGESPLRQVYPIKNDKSSDCGAS